MENEKREALLEEIQRMKETAKNINAILLPKLNKYKDAFTASEWHIVELAVDNYIIDITSKAAHLQVIAQQNIG